LGVDSLVPAILQARIGRRIAALLPTGCR
jgi:hypothetical protein